MKAMKKVFAILVVVAMVMGLSLTAFAADAAVAAVGDKTYTSISEAIAAAKDNGTVKLLADVSDVTIDAGTSVTIDLNGYTISSVKDHAITNNGTLTVTGTGTVDGGSTSGKGALFNNGTATLNGGTFTGSTWYVIKNVGTLTINSGVTVSKTGTSSGSAIDNGYASSSETGYGTGAATLTINGGTFSTTTNSTVKNDDYGTLKITGGSFTCDSTGSTIQNSGKSAEITGGSFTFTGGALGVILEYPTSDQNANPATLTISGGDFTALTGSVLSVYGSASSTVTISGGTFVGDLSDTTSGVTVTVTGGTFSDEIPSSYDTDGYTAPTTATIVVHGVAGQTYTAYKIFDVTISGDAYAYSIDPDSPWLSVIAEKKEGSDVYTSTVTGLTLTLSGDGSKYVVEVSESFDAKSFSETLLKAINEDTSNTFTGTKGEANSDGTATISGLNPGYYLVDSSLGALMILDTADVATVNEKNAEPSLTKEVLEDSTNTYGSTATADMQQEVSFKLTVNVGSIGTGIDKDYVITDTLPNGMTYVTDSLKVAVGETAWTVKSGDTENDYSVSYTTTDAENKELNVLTITLNQSKLETLAANTEIVITYTATVDEDAVVGYPEGNTNTAYLTYGTYTTVNVQATVYTYEIGEDADGNATIVKVDGSTLGSNGEVVETTTKLAGVKFVLSKTVVENGENVTYYAVLNAVWDNEIVTSYQLSGWSKTLDDVTNGEVTDPGATRIETNAEGTFVVEGLDAGEYILTETETLDGYNLLNDTITVVIAEDGAVTYYFTSEGADSADGSITVVNNSGTELPSTGGIGTTIFYVVGSILVIGAAVLLITKKRMTNVQ